jgi:hypothetical protein
MQAEKTLRSGRPSLSGATPTFQGACFSTRLSMEFETLKAITLNHST